MRRDRLTLAMIIGVPLMQLTLFGFAINFNPKALPTAVSIADPGIFSRSIIAAMNNSSYFDLIAETRSPAEARKLLQDGKVLFVVEIPENFSRDLVEGAQPDLLMEVDATDPASSGYAIQAFNALATSALRDDLVGPLAVRAQSAPPFNPVVHLLYNPESNTQYSIVPGLLAIILTMTIGVDDLHGADPRAGAGDVRESSGHARHAAGDHDWQDRALCGCGIGAKHDRPGAGANMFSACR